MFDIGVDARLIADDEDRQIVVRAFVATTPLRSLRWRLITSSRSSGGTSTVTQSGVSSDDPSVPVSIVTLSPGSRGTVVLIVFEGLQEVARDSLTLAQP